MWGNIDMNQRRTTERVIEETPIINEEEMNRCGCCHKSRVGVTCNTHHLLLSAFTLRVPIMLRCIFAVDAGQSATALVIAR